MSKTYNFVLTASPRERYCLQHSLILNFLEVIIFGRYFLANKEVKVKVRAPGGIQ